VTVQQETGGRQTVTRRAGRPYAGGGDGRGNGFGGANGSAAAGRGRRTRVVTVAVLVASLVIAALSRQWAVALQARAAASGPNAVAGADASGTGRTSLGSMDSFFLALLLGGLRGPLVMFLWVSSENQKNERDLEGFDTKIELIRLLQPEFDTVHIFQIWNKAYNQSAQIASLPNKYSVILDALDYARKVDAARPNNINILMEISRIYNHKLGTTTGDSIYYRRRVREDTKWRPESQREVRREGVPPQRHDPMLDQNGNILPERRNELAYLIPYEPFPQGLSTLALGYNYSKRSQVLMNETKQRPKQVSEPVVDSRPALMLKEWSEEEWERGREAEIRAFGARMPPRVQRERPTLEMPTAVVPLNKPFPDPSAPPAVQEEQRRQIADAIWDYETTARLARDSRKEYQRHLSNAENFVNEVQNYQSHMDTLHAEEESVSADAAYLLALTLPQGDGRRAEALQRAWDAYRRAHTWYQYMDLKYFVPADVADPLYHEVVGPGYSRQNLADVRDARPDKLNALHRRVMNAIRATPGVVDSNLYEREEYAPYQQRILERLKLVAAAQGRTPAPEDALDDPVSGDAARGRPAGPALPSQSPEPAAPAPATRPG
jgi:hypothetical protein